MAAKTKKSTKKTTQKKNSQEITQKKSAPAQARCCSPASIGKKAIFLIPLLIIIIGILLYVFRSSYLVAVVNGKPVTKFQLWNELEKQAGKQVLESLVIETLILQEAQNQNLQITQGEIDAEVQKIKDNLKQQGQELDQLLAAQGMSLDELKEQIRMQKIVEKLAAGNVVTTDEEVQEYLEKNKDFLPEDATQEELKITVKNQLEQQKQNEQVQTWIQALQEKAKITYFNKQYQQE